MTMQEYGLREDPFPIVPDGPVHNWAGQAELKEDLVDLVKGVRSRDIGVTEVVALLGEYGAGKSHALRFLKTKIDEESRKPEGDFRSLALYVERPRVSNKLNFFELYKYIIKLIGRDRIQSYCFQLNQVMNDLTNSLAEEKGMSDAKDKSSFRSEAINRLKPNDAPMIKLLCGGAEDAAKVFAFLIGEVSAEHNEYEGKIDSDFLSGKVLSDLFRVLTSDLGSKNEILESVYLFIDETEMLVDAKATEADLVFGGFRELINGIPYRFCLIMSFSAATALVEAIMPNHLLKRMTREYFDIPMLTDDEAIIFLREQLNFFRPPGYLVPNPYYPFDENSMSYIVGNQTTLTPRNLFIDCKRVFERATRRHNVDPGEVITREIAEEIIGSRR